MRAIRQLSSHMADLIAAGEVVERPMSVVKELVENSIDANATEITIEIENGGISYIRIADNGIGMSKNDAPIAFLRHSTSKIFDENDLFGIKTLGFRGEALAAISSVSQIDLFTKRVDDEDGTLVSVLAGEVQSIQAVGSTEGTTIIVRDLFYNTPARMKFLKKDYTEASYIMNIVQNLAICKPNIAFKLIKDNKIMIKTTGKGDLKSTIYSVFGREFTNELLEVKLYEIEGVSVYGFISKPHASKATRSMQHFFVNGRFVKSKLVATALEQSYKNSIMHGKFPYCVLNIVVNENKIDVNVHPTKTEVKFEQEKQVFNAVYMACKNVLDSENIFVEPKNLKPIIKQKNPEFVQEEIYQNPKNEIQEKVSNNYKNEENYDIKSFNSMENDEFESIDTNLNSSTSYQVETAFDAINMNIPEKTENIAQNNVKIENNITENEKIILKNPNSIANPVKIVGQCFNTYIICEYENEMILIDKHAAHERKNFNKLMNDVNNIQSQLLLVPKVVSISSKDYGNFIENLEEINKLGFNIEEFSESSVVVREIPMILDKDDIEDTICEIASKLKYNKNVEIDKIDDILHTIACKSAIKGNIFTNEQELESLAKDVIFNSDVNYCPHGRPIKVALTKYQLEKMFKRIL